jgi:uncharacterized protein YceK
VTKTMLLIAVALALSGCGASQEEIAPGVEQVSARGHVVYVRRIAFEDGTVCVVAWGRGSAVDCNWKE